VNSENEQNSANNHFWCLSKTGEKLGLIIRANHSVSGIEFFTPPDFGQQLALMRRPAGEEIEPHVHLPVNRELVGTQEVLIMREGRMRVDFYDIDRSYVASTELNPGDVALMNLGGHGFEILEDSLFIEVKQGPFVEGEDKIRFVSTRTGELKEVPR
jgi:hypothetical protein